MSAKFFACLLGMLCLCIISNAQLTENFTDGDFSHNPYWTGDTSDCIINSSFQLQSNDTISNSSFYLSTANALAINAQWEMYVQLKFNTSSANYVDVYLIASASDLTQKNVTGYFVRIGNTSDNICLYRKDSTGNITKLIDGVAGILNKSNNILKLKVTRDSANQWTLYRDLTGTGNDYFDEGAMIDSTYTTSSFFGIFVKQSTSSFFKKHFFDDITIKPYSADTTKQFSYIPNRYDVVIDEIMADPEPTVGLPDNEWIELKNTSSYPINLQGWTIADLTNQSGSMPNFILQPDSFVVVCTGSSVAAMSAFGQTVSVTNFPSLDNAGDELILKDDSGNVIHAVQYTPDWYQNELKKNGGWSLEMIDTKNPCSGFSNWAASTDPTGGTPGRKNSVDGNNHDQTAPQLLQAFAMDSSTITLVFNEPLDSAKAATASDYSINDIGNPQSAMPVAPLFDKVNLKLFSPLVQNKIYTVLANAVTDCAGNEIGTNDTARFGLSSLADSFDVVINEILFNPKPGGVDYVEIYNRSNKIIDLKQLYIANRNSSGVISSITQLSTDNHLLFPGGFMVITENPDAVKSQYIVLDPNVFITVNNMPSFNDDNGDAIILNAQGKMIDELKYDASWQFPLISNPQGVSLERIDYDAPTQSADNWHSAATSAGYGTPGYKNSQYKTVDSEQGAITVSPGIFSPDNDGVDDYAIINYTFPKPGYVMNATIFDASGRPVRYLLQSALCGTTGTYQWNGLGEKNQPLPTGIYIVFAQVFNLNGETTQFKNAIVLARKN